VEVGEQTSKERVRLDGPWSAGELLQESAVDKGTM